MKVQLAGLFTILNKEELNSLCSVVIETLVFNYSYVISKKFTAADLWDIQRKGMWRQRRPYL